MSLYNLLFGRNPAADLLLAMLGVTAAQVPRFRDCYLKEGYIEIYTRTGGGNREEYAPQNELLHQLPGFVTDLDDDYDCTYAHFRYTVPPRYQEVCEALRALGGSGNPTQAWMSLLTKLQDPAHKDDPEVQQALASMRPLVEKLQAAVDGKGPPVVEV